MILRLISPHLQVGRVLFRTPPMSGVASPESKEMVIVKCKHHYGNSNYIMYEAKSTKSCSQRWLEVIELNGQGRKLATNPSQNIKNWFVMVFISLEAIALISRAKAQKEPRKQGLYLLLNYDAVCRQCTHPLYLQNREITTRKGPFMSFYLQISVYLSWVWKTCACLSEASSKQSIFILTTSLVNVQDSFSRLANPAAFPIKRSCTDVASLRLPLTICRNTSSGYADSNRENSV